MLSGRDEIEPRMSAFIGSWLDSVPKDWGETFAIKTFALIFEVEFPPDEEGRRASTDIGWTCSDDRNWIQAGLFRRALVESEAPSAAASPTATSLGSGVIPKHSRSQASSRPRGRQPRLPQRQPCPAGHAADRESLVPWWWTDAAAVCPLDSERASAHDRVRW